MRERLVNVQGGLRDLRQMTFDVVEDTEPTCFNFQIRRNTGRTQKVARRPRYEVLVAWLQQAVPKSISNRCEVWLATDV